jgi:hypothetical protein
LAQASSVLSVVPGATYFMTSGSSVAVVVSGTGPATIRPSRSTMRARLSAHLQLFVHFQLRLMTALL